MAKSRSRADSPVDPGRAGKLIGCGPNSILDHVSSPSIVIEKVIGRRLLIHVSLFPSSHVYNEKQRATNGNIRLCEGICQHLDLTVRR
jgi:hypothetical protein